MTTKKIFVVVVKKKKDSSLGLNCIYSSVITYKLNMNKTEIV